MPPRHPVPRIWLMTDERLGNGLWSAVARLPRGAGIVFRHYQTELVERRALFARLLRVARRRGLVLVRAGNTPMRGEMGVHAGRGRGLVTWPAHSRSQAIAGVRAGAQILFVSPVFATRSHPAARALGQARAATIARGLPVKKIALGGMDARRYARLRAFDGWAAIDAWVAARGTRSRFRGDHRYAVRSGTPSLHKPPGCRGDRR